MVLKIFPDKIIAKQWAKMVLFWKKQSARASLRQIKFEKSTRSGVIFKMAALPEHMFWSFSHL
jgi:hypothetical protein